MGRGWWSTGSAAPCTTFPRGYLGSLHSVSGHRLNSIANRPANAAWVDWIENANISDAAPSDYWQAHAARLDSSQLEEQMRLHALPEGWHEMTYDTFLDARRPLMTEVIRDAYERLHSRMPGRQLAGSYALPVAVCPSGRWLLQPRLRAPHGAQGRQVGEPGVGRWW